MMFSLCVSKLLKISKRRYNKTFIDCFDLNAKQCQRSRLWIKKLLIGMTDIIFIVQIYKFYVLKIYNKKNHIIFHHLSTLDILTTADWWEIVMIIHQQVSNYYTVSISTNLIWLAVNRWGERNIQSPVEKSIRPNYNRKFTLL